MSGDVLVYHNVFAVFADTDLKDLCHIKKPCISYVPMLVFGYVLTLGVWQVGLRFRRRQPRGGFQPCGP